MSDLDDLQGFRKTNFSKLDFKTPEECKVLVEDTKYKALDGLRGIGAFAVYLNHFF